MKACKKCRSHNEVSAKFCFQCGTKLSTIVSGFQVPVPSAGSVRSWMSPVDPVDFIKHPMQRKEDVITSKNQGRHVAPGLAEKLGIHEQAELPPKIATGLKIAPSPNSQLLKKPLKPNVKPSQPSRRVEESQSSQLKRMNIDPNKVKTDSKATAGQQVNNGLKRKPLLEDADRVLLQTKMPSRSVSGLKPSEEIFAMKDLVRIQERKEEIQKNKLRKKKVQEDLAYLDQILPFEHESNCDNLNGATGSEIKKVKDTASVSPPSIPSSVSAGVQLEEQKMAAKIEIRKALEKDTSNTLNQDVNIAPAGEAVLVDSPRAIQTQGWLQMVQGVRQRTPSEQLKGYEHGDSSEFITPFLTLAAFLYFCYVLYI